MKFTQNDIKILENFSSINASLLFVEGKTQSTVSQTISCYAKANLESEIDQEFAIYDIRKFLSVLSLFDDPDITFEDRHVLFKETGKQAIYKFCSPELIKSPPKGKSIDVKNIHEQFQFSNNQFKQIMKFSSIFSHEFLKISEHDGKIFLSTTTETDLNENRNNDVLESASFDIGTTEKKGFSYYVKISNLPLISGDYDVMVGDNRLKFQNKDIDIYYVCAYEEKFSNPIT